MHTQTRTSAEKKLQRERRPLAIINIVARKHSICIYTIIINRMLSAYNCMNEHCYVYSDNTELCLQKMKSIRVNIFFFALLSLLPVVDRCFSLTTYQHIDRKMEIWSGPRKQQAINSIPGFYFWHLVNINIIFFFAHQFFC